MKTLKKLTAVLLALTIALSICACSSQSNKNKSYVKATSTPKPSPTVFSIFSASNSEIESFVCSLLLTKFSSVPNLRYKLGTIKREKDCIKVYITVHFRDEFGNGVNFIGGKTNKFSETYEDIVVTIPDSLNNLYSSAHYLDSRYNVH